MKQSIASALIPNHGQEWLDEVAGQANVTKTPGGLLYKEVTAGSGVATPGKRDSCKLHYRASLYDGTEFDSTHAKGEPVLLTLTSFVTSFCLLTQLCAILQLFAFVDRDGNFDAISECNTQSPQGILKQKCKRIKLASIQSLTNR